jgi:hypothetical protein
MIGEKVLLRFRRRCGSEAATKAKALVEYLEMGVVRESEGHSHVGRAAGSGTT